MRCLITAGPTYEPLDAVRRLTNFSTGRLGSELAACLARRGHEVVLLRGAQSTYAGGDPALNPLVFTTTADLRERLQTLAAEPFQAVFHAAAVSDFTFGKVWRRTPEGALVEERAGKFSTRQGPLLAELVPTPKLILELRVWFPAARLVGWKYEVDDGRTAALESARRQLRECRTDACVANGPAYGPGFGLVQPAAEPAHCPDPASLYRALADWLVGPST